MQVPLAGSPAVSGTGSATPRREARTGVFDTYTPEQQTEALSLINRLTAEGRLFIGDGELVRVNALTAFRALAFGSAPLHSAMAMAVETQSQSRETSTRFYQDFYSGFNTAQKIEGSDHDQTRVRYVTSPVESFDDLLWVDPQAPGLPGAFTLPAAGAGSVVVSQQEATRWRNESHYCELNVGNVATAHNGSDEHTFRLAP